MIARPLRNLSGMTSGMTTTLVEGPDIWRQRRVVCCPTGDGARSKAWSGRGKAVDDHLIVRVVETLRRASTTESRLGSNDDVNQSNDRLGLMLVLFARRGRTCLEEVRRVREVLAVG